MKKTILFALIFSILALPVFADTAVSPQALPKQAKTFISTHFKGGNIMYVKQDFDSFDVTLDSGVKIEFYKNGDWKEVKSYQPLPSGILPAAVEAAAKKRQPKANIIKAEKNWNAYEVKFDNGMEVFVDTKGQFLGEKRDR
ncbi:MAG: PepSY-like domain-containing protein [Mucispirillum sp.]|nr:PepSY-like domain-containing protein [Mucispirillum sp.]